jgi:hypothetical protein
MPVLEAVNTTTYRIRIGRDNIELGDLLSAQCLGHLKYLRNRGTSFVLSYPGTPTGLAVVDVPNGKVRIPYGVVTVELTAHEPDTSSPDGRAEFNVIINSKPVADANGEYWQTLNFETTGLDITKIGGLDDEYNQAKCVEEFGDAFGSGTYTITPTQITEPLGEVVKTRDASLVRTIEGKAQQNNHDTSVMGINKNNSQPITYTRLSCDTLRIPRREIIDSNGKKGQIEDIVLDGNQLKFKLPAQFMKTAKYPVQHVTGVDPAYTQAMASWQSDGYGGSDGVWGNYDIFTAKGVPKGAVAEIILSNATAGTENTLGVRTDGSGEHRYVSLHEAEGGGQTHCRMFVTVHATTGLIECYHSDVSDADYFYLVGYWGNVTFTEGYPYDNYSSFDALWTDISSWIPTTVADRVHHILAVTFNTETAAGGEAGVRANGSSLERKLKLHEAEAGGVNVLDFLVKADGSGIFKSYSTDNAYIRFYVIGYFGSEMDFVELWQNIPLTTTNWEAEDLTAYLDADGRMVDFLLVHSAEAALLTLGVRDGDDAATERKLVEHEAESAGAGGEYTGFSMSAKSNASGVVNLISSAAGEMLMLTGYFKPAVVAFTPSRNYYPHILAH